MTDDQAVQRYLDTLGTHLRSLPPGERHEIVEEIKTHVREVVFESGEPVRGVLERLGTPQQMAAQYLDHEALQRARGSYSPVPLLRALLRVSTQSVTGMLVFCFGTFGYLTGVGLVLSATLKPFFPHQIGLWNPGHSSIIAGLPKQLPASSPEILGWWYVPLALILGTLLLICTSCLIRVFLRLSRFVQVRFTGPYPRVASALLRLLGIALLLPAPLRAQDGSSTPVSDWTGILQVQSQQLHLTLHVTAGQDGVLHATLDSVD